MTKARELAELGKAVSVHDNRLDFDRSIAHTGIVTANAGVKVDNITIDGTEIDLSSGDLTIDVAGDIILDADGKDYLFKDAGTLIATMSSDNTDFTIRSEVQDRDLKFEGNDGGSVVTALQLDMSAGGNAIFNNSIAVADGDASAPGFRFKDDLNNGMFRAGTDIIGLSTAGIERLRIDANGKVGIGTTSPDQPLDIAYTNNTAYSVDNFTNSNNSGLRIENTSTTANAFSNLTFRVGSGADLFFGIEQKSANDGDFIFANQNSPDIEMMRITSGGNVGIGTNSPAYPLHLHEASSGSNYLLITNSTTGSATNDGLVIGLAADETALIYHQESSAIRFGTASTERMRIASSGHVGVGTTAPTSPLHVVSGEISNGQNKGIKIANHNASKAYSIRTGITGAENTSLSIHDDTAGASRITIDTSGRVGIGANNMGSYHANNDDLVIATSGSTGITIRSGTSDQGRIAFADGTSDNAEEIRGLIMYNHNGDAMSFFTGSNQRMIINSSGNAGIGTSAPNSRLEVRNDTNANTTLMLSSQLQTAGNYHEFALGVETFYAVGLRRTLTQSTPTYLRPRLDFFVQHYNTYQAADRSVKMSIKDTGKVGIATTTPDEGSMMTIVHPGSSVYGLRLETSQTSGTQYHLTIYRNTTHAGYITSNANNQVALNSVSDERLKKNIVNSSTATQNIKDLKVRKFDWKDDSLTGVDFGFVAQEVASIVPEAVTQGSDTVDDNGNLTQPWGIDYSHIVPRLVKTIQELEARITELENK